MKKFYSTLMALYLVFFTSFSAIASEYTAVITKISDGDTIWVQDTHGKRIKLRLLGIDTPEKYPSKKMNKDIRRCHVSYEKMKRLGTAATRHAKKLLHVGERVKIVAEGKGYYHRTLAFIILPDSTNFNERMVSDGYACVYKYHGRKSRQLSWAEWKKLNRLLENAEKSSRGLWRNYKTVMECLCR